MAHGIRHTAHGIRHTEYDMWMKISLACELFNGRHIKFTDHSFEAIIVMRFLELISVAIFVTDLHPLP